MAVAVQPQTPVLRWCLLAAADLKADNARYCGTLMRSVPTVALPNYTMLLNGQYCTFQAEININVISSFSTLRHFMVPGPKTEES